MFAYPVHIRDFIDEEVLKPFDCLFFVSGVFLFFHEGHRSFIKTAQEVVKNIPQTTALVVLINSEDYVIKKHSENFSEDFRSKALFATRFQAVAGELSFENLFILEEDDIFNNHLFLLEESSKTKIWMTSVEYFKTPHKEKNFVDFNIYYRSTTHSSKKILEEKRKMFKTNGTNFS
jgi:hypothetical protein